MNSDYIKQLEEANESLREKVEGLTADVEKLYKERQKLRSRGVRIVNYSECEWNVVIGCQVLFVISETGDGDDRYEVIDDKDQETLITLPTIKSCQKYIEQYLFGDSDKKVKMT